MPQADLPESVSSDSELVDSLSAVEPMAMLVFDEESGEFIDASGSGDANVSDAAPVPGDDDTGEGSDWVVYTAEDTDSEVSSDQSMSAHTSTSIDCDAETEEVNDLLPPPPPGRSGMRHGQTATAP